MNGKIVLGAILTLLSISMLTLTFDIQPVKSDPAMWIVDDDGPADFHTIQEAINSLYVKDGDTILVEEGIYYENVLVNKSISLVGESRSSTVIDGSRNEFVIDIVADGTVIDNFTMQNGQFGIRALYQVVGPLSSCSIARNDISNCTYGMYMLGENHSVDSNRIANCSAAMRARVIANSTIVDNLIVNNSEGLYFWGTNNTFRNNTMIDNYFNFGQYSYDAAYHEPVTQYVNNIDTSNTINGKPIYYWIDVHNKEVPADAAYVELINCTNITVSNLTLSSNLGSIILINSKNCTLEDLNTNQSGFGIVIANNSTDNIIKNNSIELWPYPASSGIFLSFSENNSIQGNNIQMVMHLKASWGLWLLHADNNHISRNVVSEFDTGVRLDNAHNNLFYHNSFINNTDQVFAPHPTVNDIWDDGYPSGGNYWTDHVTVDDYSGVNQDEYGSDGIVDEPYIIDDYNQDNYPLMEPWAPLPRTMSELKSEIEELGSKGEIDNQGIVNSLIAKLNAAQKLVDKGKIDEAKSILEEDFIPQIQNLSGIHITMEAADILIESAEYILSHL